MAKRSKGGDKETTEAKENSPSDAKADANDSGAPVKEVAPDAEMSVGHLDEEDSHSFSHHFSFRNVLAFIILVWLGQVVVSVGLKKYNIIDRDLNELVASRVIPEIQHQLERRLNDSWSFQSPMGHLMKKAERPGFQLAQKGAKGKYPVIMVPGFVTSGLELWAGEECARGYFRQRMWGQITGARQFLTERECVMKHLKLDMKTGSDPKNIRLRASGGFESSDYFISSYWVWAKILENLADVGYDSSNMSLESYDWRLAFPILEQRDGYFSKLKAKLEVNKKVSGEKNVIISHSLGAILVHYFFAWVTASEEEGGGGGGKNWVDEYIHSYVNIAGAHLGVPKAATAILSGEMSDTVLLGTLGNLMEGYFGRRTRRDLWASWGSLWTMLPKGGDETWNFGADFQHKEPGNERSELAEGSKERKITPLLDMTDGSNAMTEEEIEKLSCVRESLIDQSTEHVVNDALHAFARRKTHSVSETNQFLLDWGVGLGPQLASSKLHSFDKYEKSSNRTWHDVTRTPLPYAPNMKIYCLYGVGLDTERSYFYKRNKGEGNEKVEINGTTPAIDPPFILDTSVDDPENNIKHGVRYSDGDASVPLVSLGYTCVDAWTREGSKLNPSRASVVTREYKNENEFSVDDPMRGGPKAGDHVDVLGNVGMLEDLIKIVTDYHLEEVQEQIVSDIKNIARRINERGGGDLMPTETETEKWALSDEL